MKLTTALLFGLVACVSLSVQGAVPNRRDQSIEQKPFAWLLRRESWGSTDPDSILPKETVTTCGGNLDIAVNGQLSYIFYEPVGGFVPNERCVWVLNSNLDRLDLFTDTQSSTTGNNGLIINHFTTSATTVLTADRIPHENNAQYSYTNYNGVSYLMFTSNEVGRGLGVRLGIRASGSSNSNLRRNTVTPITESSGSLNMEYPSSILYTHLFQPRPNVHTSISIPFMDLEQDYDTLCLFTLIPYHVNGNSITSSCYTGFYPFGPPNSETSSEEPRLYILRTDASVTRDGVTLTWTSP